MRTGLVGGDLDAEFSSMFMYATDKVRFIAELPVDTVPGTRFRYSTGNTVLLNAVLANVSHVSPRQFAQQRLFGPMGGQARRWTVDATGLEIGGADLYLTGLDMLRFGLLYLNHGMAEGRQVVPRAWVDSSLAVQVSFDPALADSVPRMLPNSIGYGFLWWHRESVGRRMSCAWGYGGQFICLVPSLDLAIVVLSTIAGNPPAYYAAVFGAMDNEVVRAARP